MKFSCFTRFGFFRFSSARPRPQVFFESLGPQFDTAFDTTGQDQAALTQYAEKFALAYHLARQEWAVTKAGNQRNVLYATDMLPCREQDYLAIPGAYDDIYQRQQRLAAIALLPLGATQSNLTSMLTAALGSAFIRLRPVLPGELVADSPTSNFQPASVEPKFNQLVVPLPVTGSQLIGYGSLDPTLSTPTPFAIGDAVTVQGENKAQAEVVTVTSVVTLASPVFYGSTPVTNFFGATFTKSHDAGATATTMSFPRWTSSQCFLYVEVTPAAAVNPVVRAQVDVIMARVCRGWCGWATVTASGGSIGPFAIGLSGLGTATIGSIAA